MKLNTSEVVFGNTVTIRKNMKNHKVWLFALWITSVLSFYMKKKKELDLILKKLSHAFGQ